MDLAVYKFNKTMDRAIIYIDKKHQGCQDTKEVSLKAAKLRHWNSTPAAYNKIDTKDCNNQYIQELIYSQPQTK